MTRDEVMIQLKRLISDRQRYEYELNKTGDIWLLVGAIGLYALSDGWPKFFGSVLLVLVALYESYMNYPYNFKEARRQLNSLNRAMKYIPEDDHELISLTQKANDELGIIKPILRSIIYMLSLGYFLYIFINQLDWAIKHF